MKKIILLIANLLIACSTIVAVDTLPLPCAYVASNDKESKHHQTAFIIKDFLNKPYKVKVDFGEGNSIKCPIKVYSFSVVVGEKVINCKGNTISKEVKNAIKMENQNITMRITEIRAIYNGNRIVLAPLTIELLDEVSFHQR